ncbi:histidine kinase [Caenimonas koreensis DSM 17982]|uniref:Histidine kinase n=1 Tax=Caenimonas koreensis DSM 17982 TaxID=1121255 RepID=A0A844B4M1_9BURK|nr:helix-turn-helix domain-containing protein [Caenimonas koreensis]MRD46477.1 histidine kinase [Caenimonas koreensis DSM 17982]
MTPSATAAPDRARLLQIEQARRAVFTGGVSMTDAVVRSWYDNAWIERSWRRCLDGGLLPHQRVGFDAVPHEALRRVEEANHILVTAARPVLERLGRAIANTRYFAILTNEQGIVIDAQGHIDRSDRRASLITRIGVDLSEHAVGTTAISAALTELHPVWLHRGEHFFDDTSCYSCAGAPLFGPDGRCIGMLDLTGIDAIERPELKHLVAQSARSIENAVLLGGAHRLLLRLNWPGRELGAEDDGLLAIDGDGWVQGGNQAARELIPQLARDSGGAPLHCSEIFAQAWETLFDHAAQATEAAPLEMPLWSGLRLLVMPSAPGRPASSAPLRDVEIALIRKTVAQTRGNVAKAAQMLGISRATVYRKLSQKG